MRALFIHISTLLLCTLSMNAYAVTDDELQQAADVVNQQAPMMVDQETRLDGADSGNQVLTYNYTLVNYTAGDMDRNKFTQALRPTLLESGCKALEPLLSEGVDVQYVYRGKDKGEIATLGLTGADCGH
ncbi:MAG: hypothetical protein RI563_12395 [Thiohalophilus sp.]|uniref:hypothetical protein n=1 Tax=Thiohalophilus sp. TaxID=3028392 RepID=UPI002870AFB1|nr:hypothetical protein [Thiohalophilus sp.]MDR9437673.1 hypothetical protein [Thiohalophilus sp.]